MVPLSRSNLQYTPVATQFDPTQSLTTTGQGIEKAAQNQEEQRRYEQELLLKYGTVGKVALMNASLQKLQQDKLNDFQNNLVSTLQKRGGRLTDQDLLNISTEKNTLENWQNGLKDREKVANEQLQKAMFDKGNIFDKDAVQKNYNYFAQTGNLPDNGTILALKDKDWNKEFSDMPWKGGEEKPTISKAGFHQLNVQTNISPDENYQRNQVYKTYQTNEGFNTKINQDYSNMITAAKNATDNPDKATAQDKQALIDANRYIQYISKLPKEEQDANPEQLYAAYKYANSVGAKNAPKIMTKQEVKGEYRPPQINVGGTTTAPSAYQWGNYVSNNSRALTTAPPTSMNVPAETIDGKKIMTGTAKFQATHIMADLNKIVGTLTGAKLPVTDSEGKIQIFNSNDNQNPAKGGAYLLKTGKGNFIVTADWLKDQYNAGNTNVIKNASRLSLEALNVEFNGSFSL